MHVRNSALIVTVYFLFATVVALVGYTVFRSHHRPAVELFPALARQQPTRVPPPRREARDSVFFRSRRQSLEEATRRIDQLQRWLDETNARLQEKEALLEKKTAEYETLKTETDQYLAFAAEMLTQASNRGEDSGATQNEAQVTASRAEMERMAGELSNSESLEQSVDVELAAAQWELDQVYAQLAQQQLSTLIEAQESVQAEATIVLIDIGAPAVPHLANALTDERANIRRWSAVVLAGIGADAIGAVDALMVATRDPDEGVREAAKQALTRIEEDI